MADKDINRRRKYRAKLKIDNLSPVSEKAKRLQRVVAKRKQEEGDSYKVVENTHKMTGYPVSKTDSYLMKKKQKTLPKDYSGKTPKAPIYKPIKVRKKRR